MIHLERRASFVVDRCPVYLNLYYCDNEYFSEHSCLIELGNPSYILLVSQKADSGEVGSHSVGLSKDVIIGNPIEFGDKKEALIKFNFAKNRIEINNPGYIRFLRASILSERLRLNGITYPRNLELDIKRLQNRWPGVYTKEATKLLEK